MKTPEFPSTQHEKLMTPEQIELKIEQLQSLPLVQKAFESLDRLPEHLTYHAKGHTTDVFREAVTLGMVDGLSESDLESIAIASAWHDSGLVMASEDHELHSVALFNKHAKELDYNPEVQEKIASMIFDTKIHTTDVGPKRLMEHDFSRYLLDADVANFGRTDFREKMDLIAQERGVNMDDPVARLEFLENTSRLLKNHKWHSKAALEQWQKQKEDNLDKLQREIAELMFP